MKSPPRLSGLILHQPSKVFSLHIPIPPTLLIRRENGNEMLPEFQPVLGGLYVVESHRGHGIGTDLVRAGMQLALDLGYETVFATTVAAAGILERLGWEFIKTVVHGDEQLPLYRCKL